MNEEYTIELKERQYEWLKKMVEKHTLADESKALRCLINFVMDETDHEESVFTDIRCMDC